MWIQNMTDKSLEMHASKLLLSTYVDQLTSVLDQTFKKIPFNVIPEVLVCIS